MTSKIANLISEDSAILSSDGESEIFVRHFKRGQGKIHFLLVHGAVEHSGRHIDLVHFLLKNFFDVMITTFDHVGHGRSGGTRAYVDSFKTYVDDFGKVSEYVNSKNDSGTKTFILAHSLGGLITLTKILDPASGYQYPIDGLIFSSPCIRPLTVLAPLSTSLLPKLERISPKLHIPMIYSGKDLTRDPARANDFDTDTLIPKFISVRMAKEVLEASSKIIGLSYYLRVPSLFLIAGSDKIVDSQSTLLFAHGIDKELTKIVKYSDHYHELWNEIDRQDIFQTMKVWVDKLLKGTA